MNENVQEFLIMRMWWFNKWDANIVQMCSDCVRISSLETVNTDGSLERLSSSATTAWQREDPLCSHVKRFLTKHDIVENNHSPDLFWFVTFWLLLVLET